MVALLISYRPRVGGTLAKISGGAGRSAGSYPRQWLAHPITPVLGVSTDALYAWINSPNGQLLSVNDIVNQSNKRELLESTFPIHDDALVKVLNRDKAKWDRFADAPVIAGAKVGWDTARQWTLGSQPFISLRIASDGSKALRRAQEIIYRMREIGLDIYTEVETVRNIGGYAGGEYLWRGDRKSVV